LAFKDASGDTATCAPTNPISSAGFARFKASATFTSDGKDGVEVWSTASSYSPERGSTSESDSPRAGASTSRLPGTSAAGCPSHVGYQNDRISRFAWYRAPAPPSNPSYDGGFRNNVFLTAVKRDPPSRLQPARRADQEPLAPPIDAVAEE